MNQQLMRNKRLSVGMILILVLSACATIRQAPEPTSPGAGTPPVGGPDEPVSDVSLTPSAPQVRSPLDPLLDEDKMDRGTVLVDRMEVILLESYPLQVMLNVSGSLPTPCHNLRASFSQPNEQNQIEVELYTLVDPAEVCIQVLQSFDTTIPLGSFADGTYSVLVNGEKVGEFTQ